MRRGKVDVMDAGSIAGQRYSALSLMDIGTVPAVPSTGQPGPHMAEALPRRGTMGLWALV